MPTSKDFKHTVISIRPRLIHLMLDSAASVDRFNGGRFLLRAAVILCSGLNCAYVVVWRLVTGF